MGFAFEIGRESDVSIKVIGIGGGGGNAVNRMVIGGVSGVDFIAVNTDKQVLNFSAAPVKLQIGEKITRGRGAGSNPEVGREAAEESRDEIRRLMEGAEMVFITAGMGGGTGTGAAPIVASIAREMGILTVGIVTRPFAFEGMKRIKHAEEGIAKLRDKVDALLIIPNERLKYVSEQKITFQNAFEIADNVLRQAIQSISELITVPGLVNLDFADVETIMKDAGYAHMGVGRASGKSKAVEAAKMAIQSPLLETSIDGARGVILNITGSPDMGLEEIEEAAAMVREAAHQDAHIIFGAAIDETLDDEIRITVVATGFDEGLRNAKKLDDIFTSIKMNAEEKMSTPVAPATEAPAVVKKPAEPTVTEPVAPVAPAAEKVDTPAETFEQLKFGDTPVTQPEGKTEKTEEADDFEVIIKMFQNRK